MPSITRAGAGAPTRPDSAIAYKLEGRIVLDFTSALYLGMHHTTGALRPWRSLTTGRPAALAEPPGAAAVVNHLADLVGCERATLLPSTLHLFWDLFGRLDARNWAVFVDDGAYPIARWGVERAVGRGVSAQLFPHHDAAALRGSRY